MRHLKRICSAILISLIVIGTVAKPVPVSAGIFDKSWFYKVDEAGEPEEKIFYTSSVLDSEILAQTFYKQYMDYKGMLNKNHAVPGTQMEQFLTSKISTSSGVPGTMTFTERYITGGGFKSDTLTVTHANEEGKDTEYSRRKTNSEFVYYETEDKSFLWFNNPDKHLLNGISLRDEKVRFVNLFTRDVHDAFEVIYERADILKKRYNDYIKYIEEYIPDNIKKNPGSYSEQDFVAAVAKKIDENGRDAFAAGYEEQLEILSNGEKYGADTIPYVRSQIETDIINAVNTITNAYERDKTNMSHIYLHGTDYGNKCWTYASYIDVNGEPGFYDKQAIKNTIKDLGVLREDILGVIGIIYNDALSTLASASGADIYTPMENEVGTIEEAISEFIVSIGGQISNLLNRNGISLNSIIFGRVAVKGGIRTPVNYYTFELQNKNAYGLVGAMIFALMRVLLVFGVLIYAMVNIAKGSFAMDARLLARLKDDLAYILGATVLLLAMPNLVDGMLWIKDWVLSAIVDSFGNNIESITGTALSNAQSGAFVDAAMYLGMVLLGIYFAFVYVSTACSMMIMFGMFPLFVLMGLSDKKLIGEWFKYTVGIVIIPIIDACLLYVPVLARNKTAMPDIILVMLCMSIIPSRGVIRQMLGFGRSAGAELLGIGAMLAAGRAVSGVARTAKNMVVGAATGAIGAAEDFKAAKAYGKLADEDDKLTDTAQRDMDNNRALFDGGVQSNDVDRVHQAEYGGQKDGKYVQPLGADQDAFAQGTDGHGNIISLSDGTNPNEAGMMKLSFASSSGGGFGGSGAGLSSVARAEQARRQDIIARNAATIDNFEQYRGQMSNRQMQEMYRKRAIVGTVRTTARVAGTIAGGGVGGALGTAAGMMFGPTATIAAAGAGVAYGGEFGGGVAGVTGGVLTRATISGIESRKQKVNDRVEQRMDSLKLSEYLKSASNLGYEMFTGSVNDDISALNEGMYTQAQEARWSKCTTDAERLEELRYQRAIVNRTKTDMTNGELVSGENLDNINNSAFMQNLNRYADEYDNSVGNTGDAKFMNTAADPIGYGYYDKESMNNWVTGMFSDDRREARDLLNDPVQSSRMGMLIQSAYEAGGNNIESTEYMNARFATQKIIARNSGALELGHPTYVSDSFMAGRVWNRTLKEGERVPASDNDEHAAIPGGGEGKGYGTSEDIKRDLGVG